MSDMKAKSFILVICFALLFQPKSSDALLLGNFIGCNSFGCRLTALESEVAQLKQQVARLIDPQGMQGMNNYRPNGMMPYNQNGMNNQQQQGLNPNQSQQNPNNQPQQNGAQQTDGGPRVNFALDYPIMNSQNLRRVQGYQNSLTNGINNGQFV